MAVRDLDTIRFIQQQMEVIEVTLSEQLTPEQRAIAYLVGQIADMQKQIDALLRSKVVFVPDRVNARTLEAYGRVLYEIDEIKMKSADLQFAQPTTGND